LSQVDTGGEPLDSIRIVNTILTQIDQLRDHDNVLILATTNLKDSIDVAFIDRADLKIALDKPSLGAIYQILKLSTEELIRCGLVDCEVNFY
jgi:SpoVK/Ycf46/Vps4 family AAA+-type ATPase